MQLTKVLTPALALSPLALAQNVSAPPAQPGLVTLDVIETFTTSFTGAQASLGNVTLYVPVPTVVPRNATSGLLPYANNTQVSAPTRPVSVAIPAGSTTVFIGETTLPSSVANAGGRHADSSFAAAAAFAGVAILLS